MLALEKGRVIVECGSGARFPVLSGKGHQGRTAGRAGEPLYRTALGGRYHAYYSTFRAYCFDLSAHEATFGRPPSRRRLSNFAKYWSRARRTSAREISEGVDCLPSAPPQGINTLQMWEHVGHGWRALRFIHRHKDLCKHLGQFLSASPRQARIRADNAW